MNNKKAYNCAKLMQKYLEGANIQWKRKCVDEPWQDIEHPSWDFAHCLYRVKREQPAQDINKIDFEQELKTKSITMPKQEPNAVKIDFKARFLQGLQAHGPYIVDQFGNLYMPLVIIADGVQIQGEFIPYYELAFGQYTYMDGAAI